MERVKEKKIASPFLENERKRGMSVGGFSIIHSSAPRIRFLLSL